MLRSIAKASKKAGLLVGILCVAMTLQGCNIAAIMSAAGGLLAGLGQAFGGQTGQMLGQIGQVLGGVGQAFGQQQAGVAGQLAGAVTQPGGPLAQPGINVGQNGVGINVGQTGINVGQNGVNVSQNGVPLGQVQLPNPNTVFQQTVAAIGNNPNLTPQQIAEIARRFTPDPNQAAQIANAIIQQRAQGVGQYTPPFVAQNGQGAPAGVPLGTQPQFGQGGGFQAGLNIAQGIIGLVNAFRGGNTNNPVQPANVPTTTTTTGGTPPSTTVVTTRV